MNAVIVKNKQSETM